jgi:putative ABC transport system permease protein
MFTTFGVVGLLLAAVGLYAVTSFDVAARRREMGVRLSLGASPRDLLQRVLRDSVRPALVGVAIGIVLSLWAAQFLQSFLHKVDARDPWTFGLVALTLVLAAVAAAWIPARRASRTDPTEVLRAQ